MKKNEKYIVECIDDTNQGSGVVKINDQVVFVPDLLKGEVAKIKVLKVLKNYSFGKIIEIIESSPARIEPKCKVSNKCGGCSYQHIDYAAQLELKTRHLKNRVERKFRDIEVKDTLGMNDPFYYRNKAQFPVQINDGKVVMGFYRKHSNDIVPCDVCLIQTKKINEIYQFIKENITLKMADGLRHILMRYADKTDNFQIVFIGSKKQNYDILIKTLLDKFDCIKSIVFNLNKRNDNVILGDKYEVLYGEDYILENCMSNLVKLHFKSFYQVNPSQMEVLYSCAIEAAELTDDMTCIEMYSGVGTIGMAVSKYVKKVIGVEIVPEAVKNAKENCKLNGIVNCEYVCQDATIFAKECKDKKMNVDVVFVDPPRKGMTHQGIQDITTISPKKVVYVSCNYETLIRDLASFEQFEYKCKCIQPVDMFCHTTGLECVALIEK